MAQMIGAGSVCILHLFIKKTNIEQIDNPHPFK